MKLTFGAAGAAVVHLAKVKDCTNFNFFLYFVGLFPKFWGNISVSSPLEIAKIKTLYFCPLSHQIFCSSVCVCVYLDMHKFILK